MTLHAPIDWRLVLTDLDGNYLSILDGVAQDIEFQFRMNRSAMLNFNVPSEEPRINIEHGGRPYLDVNRYVKAYRKTSAGPTESPRGWDLKYVGRVWTLEDQGDGDLCTTQVTCFDSLKYLEKRICRSATGTFKDNQVKFWSEPGSTIIKKLIERTRDFAGAVCIDLGGGFVDTADQTVAYDQQYIMDAVIALCDTGTVDLSVEYLDTFNGVFLRLGADARLGSSKEHSVVFSYAMAPNTAMQYDRIKTMDDLANSVYLFGKSQKGRQAHASDTDSMTTNGMIAESVETLPDVETVELLEALADYQVQIRKDPRDLVTVIPTPESSARPWDDYWLGDSVSIQASDPALDFPVTREQVTGVQRVYGLTLSVDNDYGEKVTDIVVSPADA